MPDPVSRRAARTASLVAVPVALLAGLLVFWLMGGVRGGSGPTAAPSPSAPRPQVTTPVTMPAPELTERATLVCRALLSRMPDTMRDLGRRPVSAGPEQNAAYGEPAITVSCGGPAAAYPRDALLWGVTRVCWYAEQREHDSVWTAIDREVPVRITVPQGYPGAGDWVAAFTPAVLAAVPSAIEIPQGCR